MVSYWNKPIASVGITKIIMISGSLVKNEFAACALGMDLPQGHHLRDQLAIKKKKFEDLLEEMPFCTYLCTMRSGCPKKGVELEYASNASKFCNRPCNWCPKSSESKDESQSG